MSEHLKPRQPLKDTEAFKAMKTAVEEVPNIYWQVIKVIGVAVAASTLRQKDPKREISNMTLEILDFNAEHFVTPS